MSGWNILYIDDSQVELRNVARALTAAGHEITTRAGPYDCDEPLARAQLVIIDYHLAGTNGRETLEALRERARERAAPPRFYLYTSDKEIGADYRSLGFDGRFILKGNVEALTRQISAAVRTERLLQLRAKRG